jgi:hypothetical protein
MGKTCIYIDKDGNASTKNRRHVNANANTQGNKRKPETIKTAGIKWKT